MSSTIKKTLMALVAVAAFALGGAAIAGAVQNSDGSTSQSGGSTTVEPAGDGGDHQRGDETPLTGETASKVTEVALAKVGGGTVERVETDTDGNAAYEAHIVKSDGSEVTVYVDTQFSVVGVDEHTGHRGSGPGNETPLTGDTETSATKAALAATGGGTVERAETDSSGGGAYEVHIVKQDGTEVAVHLDKEFNVLSVDQHGQRPDGDQQGTDQQSSFTA